MCQFMKVTPSQSKCKWGARDFASSIEFFSFAFAKCLVEKTTRKAPKTANNFSRFTVFKYLQRLDCSL